MNKNNSKRLKSRESRGDRIFSGVNVVILLLLCVVTLYPIWYVLCASFTSNTYLISHPGMILWPHEFTLGAYKLALTHPLLISGYKNILIVLFVSRIFYGSEEGDVQASNSVPDFVYDVFFGRYDSFVSEYTEPGIVQFPVCTDSARGCECL